MSCPTSRVAVGLWSNQDHNDIICCYYDGFQFSPSQTRFKRYSNSDLGSSSSSFWNNSEGTIVILIALITSFTISIVGCAFCHQKRNRALSFADLTRRNENNADERIILADGKGDIGLIDNYYSLKFKR